MNSRQRLLHGAGWILVLLLVVGWFSSSANLPWNLQPTGALAAGEPLSPEVAPNEIHGYAGNYATSGVQGATISGGREELPACGAPDPYGQQMLVWTGDHWACTQTYNNINADYMYTPDFKIETGPNPWEKYVSIAGLFRLPENCTNGQVPRWDTTSATWKCTTNNTYTAGTGLKLVNKQFSLDEYYRLPQGCATGKVAKWSGMNWYCGPDETGTASVYTKDGKIGIGETNPETLLHLSDDGSYTPLIRLEDKGDKWDVGVFGNQDIFVIREITSSSAKNRLIIEKGGNVRVGKLTIDNGMDLAEPFAMAGRETILPGMLVSIDPDHPGQLRLSTSAYDRKVAGCVSGANGLNPGLVLQQQGIVAENDFPVALSGRVYCWADATYGPIQPGDLLTTSNTPGFAMVVSDYSLAMGAVIGKAMSGLESGQGLVLVLVTLQ